MGTIDKLFSETMRNIEAAGKHRKDPEWGQSLPFESPYDVLDTPGARTLSSKTTRERTLKLLGMLST